MVSKDWISLVCTCAALFLSVYVANKNSIKESTSDITTLALKIDNLLSMMTEMKGRQEASDKMQREDHDNIIKMQQSIKAAWRAIDEVKGEAYEEKTHQE